MPPPLAASAGYDAQLILSSPTQAATYYVRYAQGNLPFAAGTIPAGGRVFVTAGPDHIAPFDVAGAQGLFVVSTASDLVVEQLTTGVDWQLGATIPGQWALGQRFRVAGFSLDEPPEAYDALSFYAPTGAVIEVQALGTTVFSNGATGSTVLTLAARQSIVINGTDFDGALITASKPIMVMAGGRGYSTSASADCNGNDAGDIVIPTNLWGRAFVLGSFSATSEKDIRIVADSDATQVTIDGGPATTLDAGQTLAVNEGVSIRYVEADKPIAVFHNSGWVGCQVELAYVPPVVFADIASSTVGFDNLGDATLAVVGRAIDRPTLTLNGAPFPGLDEAIPGRPDLFYTAFDITDGSFLVAMSGDFQVATVSSGNGLGGRFTYFNPVRADGCGDGVQGASEACDDANLLPNDTCSPVCTIEPTPGGCVADTDCTTATHFCNGTTLFCEAKRANGAAIPNDGLHDGTCSVANGPAICASGQCNTRTDTCAGPLRTACDGAEDCIVDHCGANDLCGYADGEGPCDTASALTRCQSSACSTANVCIPIGGCYVDSECASNAFCARNLFACAPDRATGETISDDGLHVGGCTPANATATCLSAACNDVVETCAVPNGEACTADNQCIRNVCGSNDVCGIANDDSCARDTPGLCQSDYCSVALRCIDPGTCLADGDCPTHTHCDRAGSRACVPDLTDGAHGCTIFDGAVCESDRCSTAHVCIPEAGCWVNSDCVSTELCDRDALTCRAKQPDGAPCDDDHACLFGICSDGICGVPVVAPPPPPPSPPGVPEQPVSKTPDPDTNDGGCNAFGRHTDGALAPLLAIGWLATRRRKRG